MAKPAYFFITIAFLFSLFLHLIAIDYPKEAVFDEVHFGKFVSGYLTGEYFFDIHPPLGKLMIAGAAKLAGFSPGFDFLTIGEQYPNNQYMWLRLLPALFGSLLAPLIFLLTFRLSRSLWAACIAALFIVFENGILVQSKFILMDSFLLFFGFAAIYFFLESRIFFDEGRWGLWACIVAAIASGFAFSVKWTAASFWGLLLIVGFIMLVKKIIAVCRRREKKNELFKTAAGYGLLLVIPLIIYVVFFAVHFNLLPRHGSGNAYMGERFQKSQQAGFPSRDFMDNFYELNLEMFRSNQRITATHSYSSKWYTWPFMLRPVYYWNSDVTVGEHSWYAKIYFIGNPFVWWLSTITVIYFFIYNFLQGLHYVFLQLWRKLLRKSAHEKQKPLHIFIPLLLCAAYLGNFLPFIFIGRVMFLYHYLTALVIAIMITAIMLASRPKPRKIFISFLITGTICGFFVMFPITYGTILNTSWPSSVFWLKSWI